MTESFWVSPLNPAPFDAHMRIVAKIEPHTRGLDVGCNTGELGEQLKKRLGCYVVGVETQPSAAEVAKTRLDKVICGHVMSFPEQYPPNGQFDYVLAADVLEHLPRPQARRASPALFTGGRSSLRCPTSQITRCVFRF